MSGRSIAIVANMTDRDVVERAAVLMDGRTYSRPVPCPDRHRPQWRAQVKGPSAAGWMMTIYPLLGHRRREQVKRTLSKWRAMRYVRISPLVERSILEAWAAGGVTKVALARRFAVSRETIYNVLDRSRDHAVMEHGSSALTPIDIAWLAGLVEGEGNISINGRSFTIRIKMADHDVVERASALLGGKLYPVKAPRSGWKAMWLTQVKGATAAGWAMTLYPWLGRRRRQQVRDALAHWRRQGNGAINTGLADAILAYRTARFSQAEIMALLRVSKSTVYRCTRSQLRRMRVTRQQQAARPAIGPIVATPS
jgi:DNA-binding CsgD family transcriptional regulator